MLQYQFYVVDVKRILYIHVSRKSIILLHYIHGCCTVVHIVHFALSTAASFVSRMLGLVSRKLGLGYVVAGAYVKGQGNVSGGTSGLLQPT